MTGMFTLVFIVCLAAIFCFFSQEFVRLFKKIWAIKGAPLLLPLAAASWFVFTCDDWVLWGLYYVCDVFKKLIHFFLNFFPDRAYSFDLVLILFLTILSVGPVTVLHIISYKKTYKPFPHPYLVSTLIWVIAALLLISLPALYH